MIAGTAVDATRRAPVKTLDEIRAELRAMLPELRERYPVAGLGVFGSYARGEQREGSDLDLLVDFDGPVGIFEFLDLEEGSGDGLGRGWRWSRARR
jgi:uncharacterized protein